MEEHFFHKKELIDILEHCLNKTLGEVDVNHVFDRAINHPKITGIAGDVIEQSVLGYPADSRQEPDLNIDGVLTELKTTGIKFTADGSRYEAKEPMSITAVSPPVIVNEDFGTSNLWHKLDHLLFVYYLYASKNKVSAAEYANFPIKGYEFYEFDEEDRKILENDWKMVRDFIRELQENYADYESQYPRISSELRPCLLFIDTAPKWPHPPRFRLKRSVVTTIVQKHFGASLEQLPGKYSSYLDIDAKCHELTQIYGGKTVGELIQEFGITGAAVNKSIGERIIVRMFDGQTKKMQQIDLFKRISLIGKSITVTRKGLRTEDTKLFCIDFSEFDDTDSVFEESMFYDYFADSQMLCIIFEEPSMDAPLTENRFLGFKRISFDDTFIDANVRPVWNRIRSLIQNHELVDVVSTKKGVPIINKTGVVSSAPNFPKSSEGVIFVRGSATDSTNKTESVNGIAMYKQYLWMKGSFLVDTLASKKYL